MLVGRGCQATWFTFLFEARLAYNRTGYEESRLLGNFAPRVALLVPLVEAELGADLIKIVIIVIIIIIIIVIVIIMIMIIIRRRRMMIL